MVRAFGAPQLLPSAQKIEPAWPGPPKDLQEHDSDLLPTPDQNRDARRRRKTLSPDSRFSLPPAVLACSSFKPERPAPAPAPLNNTKAHQDKEPLRVAGGGNSQALSSRRRP